LVEGEYHYREFAPAASFWEAIAAVGQVLDLPHGASGHGPDLRLG
jgi:hypothetical protein